MNNMEYKPNSHKYQQAQKEGGEERKKFEKAIAGKAKVKKNEIRKFTDVFIAEDAREVKSWLFTDILVPRLKDTFVDMITGALNMIFYGQPGSRKSSTNASRVSYRSYYDKKDEPRAADSSRGRTFYSYDDITLETRPEAEDVLERLEEAIKSYGMVSVGDLYDLVGIASEYTDYKYGWYNLRNADVVRVREGYLLKLPKAEPLR
jgi:hypothetical protein